MSCKYTYPGFLSKADRSGGEMSDNLADGLPFGEEGVGADRTVA